MSDAQSNTPAADGNTGAGKRRYLPQLRSRWWTLLLILSLMANFLVVGLALGFRFEGGRPERMMGASYIQLVPRDFLRQLPRERRAELMGVVHGKLHQLRELRATSQASPLLLADALDNPNATDADIKAAVDAFTTGSGSLAAGGGAVVLDMVAKLTPDERKLLAQSIRDRAARMDRRNR
jgi:hypothetical protein